MGSANYLTVWSSLGVQSAPWFLTLLSWMVPFRTQASLSIRTLLRSGFASQLQAGPYQKQVPIAKPRSPYPLKVSLHVTKPRSCVLLLPGSHPYFCCGFPANVSCTVSQAALVHTLRNTARLWLFVLLRTDALTGRRWLSG